MQPHWETALLLLLLLLLWFVVIIIIAAHQLRLGAVQYIDMPAHLVDQFIYLARNEKKYGYYDEVCFWG
jgi:hypothetical protein